MFILSIKDFNVNLDSDSILGQHIGSVVVI